MSTFNSQNFKIKDASSYDALTEQFDYFTERFTLPLAEYLISLAKISHLDSIIDIGTGTGIVALQAANLADFGGMIYGIDLSEEMLRKAEAKTEQMNKKNLKFLQMDAESLKFDDKKFDVAVSLFALLHFPNPLDALNEIYRVLRPGGRLVLGVGSSVPIFSIKGFFHIIRHLPDYLLELQGKRLFAPRFLDSLVKMNTSATHEPEESNLAVKFKLNRPKAIVSLIKKAGFEISDTSWFGHRQVIASPEEFWELQRTFSSVSRKRLALVDKIKYRNIYNRFIKRCHSTQLNGGCLVYPSGAFYIVARRPSKL